MDPTPLVQLISSISRPARRAAPPGSDQDLSKYLGPAGGMADPTALTPVTPPQPLPPWMSPATQSYIRSRPSYGEGQTQGPKPNIAGGEPYSPTPQIDDIRRLFGGSIQRNSPTSTPPVSADLLRKLYAMPGFSGFTGGDDI